MNDEQKMMQEKKEYTLLSESEVVERGTSKSINLEDNAVEDLFQISCGLIEIVKKEKALGVAAVQVGIPLKVAVIRVSDGKRDVLLPVMNPIYFPMGSRTQNVEGCLTLPNELFKVKRYKQVKGKFWTFSKDGTEIVSTEMKFRGLDSFIFQHETDHCNGILCSQKGHFFKKDDM